MLSTYSWPKLGRRRKRPSRYKQIVEDYLFVPFSVETLGPWSESTKTFTKEIGRRLIERSGDGRAAAFLTQRISLAIQRGNSAAAMGTLPMGSSLDEMFYILS
ncbi:hypothetical protein M8J77_021595 [Diaphorina citri]|nr:hypothetical protein M8J77_021595 [Diaphorina citri]